MRDVGKHDVGSLSHKHSMTGGSSSKGYGHQSHQGQSSNSVGGRSQRSAVLEGSG